MIERLLSEALVERFKEEDLDDCFLVEIEIKQNDRVEVYIDSDSSLPIEKCRKTSRYLEKLIEENGWLGERYTLEVSSPGLDRPLKLMRQYLKNIGRKIRVISTDDTKIEGKLKMVADNSLSVQKSDNNEVEIPFENIKTAKILVSFK